VIWEGVVSGPDRLRFLGVLSRYAGLINGVEMHDTASDKPAGLRPEPAG
jgi:ABC-2 type transport system ATP-binding protein